MLKNWISSAFGVRAGLHFGIRTTEFCHQNDIHLNWTTKIRIPTKKNFRIEFRDSNSEVRTIHKSFLIASVQIQIEKKKNWCVKMDHP